MSFSPTDFSPKPSNWFSTNIEYVGRGHADFVSPQGWIEGDTKVQVDETGQFSITMRIDRFDCEFSLGLDGRRGDLFWLLNGYKPEISGGIIGYPFPLEPNNTCSKFSMRTNHGVLEALDAEIIYSHQFNEVKFFPHECQFKVDTARRAKYWVLPLSNFISEPFLCHPIFGYHPIFRHPLRLMPATLVPEGLPNDQRQAAYLYANGRNNLIVFKFGRGLCFIEPLPDFEERREKLQHHQANNLITGVMVGRVGDKSSDFSQAREWLPIDAVHLLSLATGTFVGIPWIEFRSPEGELVSRIQTTRLWQADYQKGHAAVDVRKIGRLLAQAPRNLSPSLRTALRLTVKGSKKGLSTEDNLSYLVRALDTLCQADNAKPDFSSIAKNCQVDILKITKEAGQALNHLADQADLEGRHDEARLIRDIIAQRVFGATDFKRRPKFDEAIHKLLRGAEL